MEGQERSKWLEMKKVSLCPKVCEKVLSNGDSIRDYFHTGGFLEKNLHRKARKLRQMDFATKYRKS